MFLEMTTHQDLAKKNSKRKLKYVKSCLRGFRVVNFVICTGNSTSRISSTDSVSGGS